MKKAEPDPKLVGRNPIAARTDAYHLASDAADS